MILKAKHISWEKEDFIDLSVRFYDEITIVAYHKSFYYGEKTYLNIEAFFNEWKICSLPKKYKEYTGEDIDHINNAYLETYNHILTKYRENRLIEIGI